METVDQIEGPVHVSFKQVKSTVPEGKYKFLFAGYKLVTSSKGTQGVQLRLAFDPNAHSEYEKKVVFDNLWFTPEAINMYLSFLVACKINPELLREEPIPGEFNPDGSPVTQCVYSTEDQLKAIYGATVYADVTEEDYEGKGADGVTSEKKWTNRIKPRSYSKA